MSTTIKNDYILKVITDLETQVAFNLSITTIKYSCVYKTLKDQQKSKTTLIEEVVLIY